jgi:hypothetical protein
MHAVASGVWNHSPLGWYQRSVAVVEAAAWHRMSVFDRFPACSETLTAAPCGKPSTAS